jgi:hypothetical protein
MKNMQDYAQMKFMKKPHNLWNVTKKKAMLGFANFEDVIVCGINKWSCHVHG